MHRREFLQLSGLAAMQTIAPQSAASQEAAQLKDLEALVTAAPPKNREVEAAKARARAEARYG